MSNYILDSFWMLNILIFDNQTLLFFFITLLSFSFIVIFSYGDDLIDIIKKIYGKDVETCFKLSSVIFSHILMILIRPS